MSIADRGNEATPYALKPKGGLGFRRGVGYNACMKTMRYTYWQHEGLWLAYIEELQENLRDLYEDLSTGAIPEVRRTAELQVG